MEENNFKEAVTKSLDNLGDVKSVICIASDGDHCIMNICSEGRKHLQNMLIEAMLKKPAIRDLFRGAILASQLIADSDEG